MSALLALLCAVAFPVMPVDEPVVRYRWPVAGSAPTVALPLMPYQPVSFTASATCAAVRATPPGATVLTTTPETTPPGPWDGMRWRRTGDGLTITSNGVAVALVGLPAAADCRVAVSSTPDRTVTTLDGRVVAESDRDLRPVVAVLATSTTAANGLGVELRTDTRFETSPSPWKVITALGALAGLVGLLVGARMLDGSRPPPPGRRRPTFAPVDAAVGAGLVAWAAVGPSSVDDGYIAGIVRSRTSNGYTGNVSRWLNAPEAPFGWFYEVEHAWSALAPGPASVLWLRVPATVLGAVCWWVVRRHVLPRVLPGVRGGRTAWIAAAMFAAWWIPFGLTLRPEPWVAVGFVAVWVLTERALTTGALRVLVLAALVAGLTVATTPSGLVGLLPLCVALPTLVRRIRSHRALRLLAVAAAGSIAALPMAADQSPAAILEATRVRGVVPGWMPWWSELQRYGLLLTPGELQGALQTRLPVILLLVALPGVGLAALRRSRGLATGPVGRLLGSAVGTLGVLTLTPTKWTLHFGALIGVGTALLTVFVVAWWPGRSRSRRFGPVAVLAGVLLAATLVLLGHHQWAWPGSWGLPTGDAPLRLGRKDVSDVVTLAAVVIVPSLLVLVALRGRAPRWITPSPVVVALVVAVTAVVGGSFVEVVRTRPGSFSFGADTRATLAGDPCGLPRYLRVETDPLAGLLPPAPGPPRAESAVGFEPTSRRPAVAGLDVADRRLPGWTAVAGRPASLVSRWYVLPPDAREGRVPVVVTVSGSLGERSAVAIEFSGDPRGGATMPSVRTTGVLAGTSSRDVRGIAPTGATVVRVVAVAAARDGAQAVAAAPLGTVPDVAPAVSVPRVPRTAPFDDVVRPGSTALTDWPVALGFGCLRPAALAGGTAEVPPFRLTAPDDSSSLGDIAVGAATGGPFLMPHLLVSEVRLPVYLDGDPAREPIGLRRWSAGTVAAATPSRDGTERRAAWARSGHATVPGTDPP